MPVRLRRSDLFRSFKIRNHFIALLPSRLLLLTVDKVPGIREKTYGRPDSSAAALIWRAVKFLSCSFRNRCYHRRICERSSRRYILLIAGPHRGTKRSAGVYRDTDRTAAAVIMWHDCDTAVQLPWHEESTSLQRAWNEDENGAAPQMRVDKYSRSRDDGHWSGRIERNSRNCSI